MSDAPKKLTGQEGIKTSSNFLRGDVLAELADDNLSVSDASYELLKFHGSYQGYNRDTATERKKQGLDKEYEFMLRMKLPAGQLKPEQYLALDDICEKYANGTLRITTRQTFQFHVIGKHDLAPMIKDINTNLLSTLGGCGDVVRNVMTTAAPVKDNKHKVLSDATHAIAKHFEPQSKGYIEMWVDGQGVAPDEGKPEEVEPIYQNIYLPRKFKISVSTPEDNTMDALIHDIACIAIFDGQDLKGYNIAVGGGLGMTHNKPATYPRLASTLGFVEPDNLLKACQAVVEIHRDFGDRTNRKHARLKYVVEEQGVDWMRTETEKYMGFKFTKAPEVTYKTPDHMGWHEQGDGKLWLGVPVSSGRIIDRDDTDNAKIRSGFRELIKKFNCNIRLTGDQNIIFCDINPSDKQAITELLKSYNIPLKENLSELYRNTLACVALPTCGKALAEAERIKLPLVEQLEDLTKKHGLEQNRIAIRIAGCPNGCSRPYVGEIGIVGRMPGHYALFIGGDFEATRLSQKVFDRIPYEELPNAVDSIFALYKSNANDNEPLGEFIHRHGEEEVKKHIISQNQGKKWAV